MARVWGEARSVIGNAFYATGLATSMPKPSSTPNWVLTVFLVYVIIRLQGPRGHAGSISSSTGAPCRAGGKRVIKERVRREREEKDSLIRDAEEWLEEKGG
jgi:hypothetical protein